jgi:hypothetical protein
VRVSTCNHGSVLPHWDPGRQTAANSSGTVDGLDLYWSYKLYIWIQGFLRRFRVGLWTQSLTLARQVLYNLSFFFLTGTGIWIQGLALTRKALYHLSHASIPKLFLFLVYYFGVKQSEFRALHLLGRHSTFWAWLLLQICMCYLKSVMFTPSPADMDYRHSWVTCACPIPSLSHWNPPTKMSSPARRLGLV